MGFEPFFRNVLIRRNAAETVTKGGILIAEVNQEKPMEGTVVAIGGGVLDSVVTAGDVVLFGKYAGTEIVVDNEPLLLVELSDLLGRRK